MNTIMKDALIAIAAVACSGLLHAGSEDHSSWIAAGFDWVLEHGSTQIEAEWLDAISGPRPQDEAILWGEQPASFPVTISD